MHMHFFKYMNIIRILTLHGTIPMIGKNPLPLFDCTFIFLKINNFTKIRFLYIFKQIFYKYNFSFGDRNQGEKLIFSLFILNFQLNLIKLVVFLVDKGNIKPLAYLCLGLGDMWTCYAVWWGFVARICRQDYF